MAENIPDGTITAHTKIYPPSFNANLMDSRIGGMKRKTAAVTPLVIARETATKRTRQTV